MQISQHCKPGFLNGIASNQLMRAVFKKFIENDIPFVSVIDGDHKFVGNIWITSLQSIDLKAQADRTLEDTLKQYPSILEKSHVLQYENSMDIDRQDYSKHHVFPVVSGKKLVGHVNVLQAISDRFLGNQDFSNAESTKNILLVDDDVDVLAMLKRKLEKHGYQCLTATNGDDAIKLWRQSPKTQMILTDLRMPGVDGIDLISQIREIDSAIPIIVLTGHGKRTDLVQCIKLGANDYLDKPFDTEVLVQIIQRLDKAIMSQKRETTHRRQLSLVAGAATTMMDSVKNLSKKHALLVKQTANVLNCQSLSLVLIQPEDRKILVSASTSETLRGLEIELEEEANQSIEDQLPDAIKSLIDVDCYGLVTPTSSYGEYSSLVVPLSMNDQTYGFIVASKKISEAIFSKNDFELLQYVAQPLSLMIDYAAIHETYCASSKRFESEASVERSAKQQFAKLALLGELSSIIAHEISNPLTVVRNYSDSLVRAKSEFAPEVAVTIDSISRNIGRIEAIVSSISRLSQTNASNREMEFPRRPAGAASHLSYG